MLEKHITIHKQISARFYLIQIALSNTETQSPKRLQFILVVNRKHYLYKCTQCKHSHQSTWVKHILSENSLIIK